GQEAALAGPAHRPIPTIDRVAAGRALHVASDPHRGRVLSAEDAGQRRVHDRAMTADRAILVAFGVIFALHALSSVARKSATFDEPSDLVSGYLELTQGQYWWKPETLPLAKLVAAAPLLALRVRTPPLDGDRFTLYARTLYEFNDGDRLLMIARAAVLPFSLLLGGLVFV